MLTLPPNAEAGTALVWNADLTLQSDTNPAALQRRQAIAQARQNRARTAHIEREIMLAVVLLYVLILGSFAALHWYGHHSLQAHGPGTPTGQEE